MKKKSLLTMLVALTLVAVVGVGATLAYLSSTTGTLTNTFTVGNGIEIKQDESDESTPENPDDRTETGNNYTDVQPGDVLVKDPTVTVKANSTECFVFMQLTGADALTAQQFTFNGFDSAKWIKADGKTTLDGVYRYYTTVAESEADQVLAPLFTSVTYSIDAEELADGVTLSTVEIKSCAVQAKNMNADSAYDAAVDTIK